MSRARLVPIDLPDFGTLADESLREAFAGAYPDAWRRIEARRRFMAEDLGIRPIPMSCPSRTSPPICRRSS
jgi:hypothetical protein